jgi:hypothetical protein
VELAVDNVEVDASAHSVFVPTQMKGNVVEMPVQDVVLQDSVALIAASVSFLKNGFGSEALSNSAEPRHRRN